MARARSRGEGYLDDEDEDDGEGEVECEREGKVEGKGFQPRSGGSGAVRSGCSEDVFPQTPPDPI